MSNVLLRFHSRRIKALPKGACSILDRPGSLRHIVLPLLAGAEIPSDSLYDPHDSSSLSQLLHDGGKSTTTLAL